MNLLKTFRKEVNGTTQPENSEIEGLKRELSAIQEPFYQKAALIDQGTRELNYLDEKEKLLLDALERMDKDRIIGNLDFSSFKDTQREYQNVQNDKVLLQGQLEPLRQSQASLSARMSVVNARIQSLEQEQLKRKFRETKEAILSNLESAVEGLGSLKSQLIESEINSLSRGLFLLGRANAISLENFIFHLKREIHQLRDYLNITSPK